MLYSLDKNFKVSKHLKGIHFGIVVQNNDPEQAGRIKVKIAGVLEAQDTDIDSLPYISPADSIGGTTDNGSVNIPQINTQVLVQFMEEDPYSGIYTSSIMTKKAFPTVFQEDYPQSTGRVWAGDSKSPSWFKINKSEEYIEVYLSPSKTLIKIDVEGRVYISSTNDISIQSNTSLNLSATNNINLSASNINLSATTLTSNLTNKNENIQNLNIASTNTALDLGTLVKKTISEKYSTTSIGITVPNFVISGIINVAQTQTGMLNGSPLETLYTGSITYNGQPYVPGSTSPVNIPPIDTSPVQAANANIQYIQNLINAFIEDYTATSQFMKNQADEIRLNFKKLAAKLLGTKDYTIRKEETNYLDPYPLAEEVVVVKTGLVQLQEIEVEMNTNLAQANLTEAQLASKYTTDVAALHPELVSGFGPDHDYKELFTDISPDAQVEILDKFNETAPPDLKLKPPAGYPNFESTPPDVYSQWTESVPKESFLPVVNGELFNLLNLTGLSTWAQTSSLTTITNNKQRTIIPSLPQPQKDQFNALVQKVRQIEIVSCKIYEIINLVSQLTNALANLQIDINKIIQALTSIEVILPTWILDFINQLIQAIKTGDLPKTCTPGAVSPEELQSLPNDLAALLGEQNSIVTTLYSNEKLYSTITSSLVPSIDFITSATTWSKSATPSSGINIIS